MCGIAGFWSTSGIAESDLDVARSMALRLAHRGPDDSGEWHDAARGVVLAHRRLSVLDLSSAGHQPMVSPSGRWVIVFNGEIYNHLALRRELEIVGHTLGWTGHSDTETLLAAFDVWGISTTLKKAVGMFGFAAWDRETSMLTLGRDRFGEKPLYYGWCGNTFLFGSELKALRAHPRFSGEIDRGALALFLRHGCIPAPHSIYDGISKLAPGTVLHLHTVDRRITCESYWTIGDAIAAGRANPFCGSTDDAETALENLLGEAVVGQTISDVPIGAFLSGGIDSSLVVALMQARLPQSVRTFSIGFREAGYDESAHAKAVAKCLETDHTELYVSPRDAIDVIPQLPQIYDEPFADASQIPTFLLAKLARQEVTVALTGDGGDEVFGGYRRHLRSNQVWSLVSRMPPNLRQSTVRLLAGFVPQSIDSVMRQLSSVVGERSEFSPSRVRSVISALGSPNCDALYHALTSQWGEPQSVVVDAPLLADMLSDQPTQVSAITAAERMMELDARGYLPDDILVKVDRASMAVGLETRAPYLDHRVFEFAWRLPVTLKLRGGQSKWIARQILERYIPKDLIDRPKQGFSVPISTWLGGTLRAWAEELLDETRLRQEGFFDSAPIRQKWAEHISGKRNWHRHLWSVLMFQAWKSDVDAERQDNNRQILPVTIQS